MNKKCGNCEWLSDKCKNPDNIHFNKYREKNDRCSTKVKVVHLFDINHCIKFPGLDMDRLNATKCGYVRKNITSDRSKVTCKLCLREMRLR